ncbi:hypothetical protein ACFQ5D_16680 [Paenibacillus farraposensis]|uniref:Uncharacterized protein n=2 Tax=Paenibacillus farraposensis TaxID=2807095 RepID=A0ABW4DGN6_9BACL
MGNDFFNAEIWEKAWKEDSHISVNKNEEGCIDAAHAFDQKAPAFDKEVFSDEGRR